MCALCKVTLSALLFLQTAAPDAALTLKAQRFHKLNKLTAEQMCVENAPSNAVMLQSDWVQLNSAWQLKYLQVLHKGLL